MDAPRSTLPIFDAHIDAAMPVLDARDSENAAQVRLTMLERLQGGLLSIWARWPEMRVAGDEAFREAALEAVEAALVVHQSLHGVEVLSREDLMVREAPLWVHHLEGGDVLATDEGLVERMFRLVQRGVRSLTPIYSEGNLFGGGSNQPSGPGLSEQGRDLLALCEDLGVAVDTAHMNEKTRSDVLQWATGRRIPVHYTHGGLSTYTRYPDGREQERGIPLEHAQEIMARGGIVGCSPTLPFAHTPAEFATTVHTLLNTTHGPAGTALGTDFGGVPPSWLLPGFANHEEVAARMHTIIPDPALRTQVLSENVRAALRRSLTTRQKLARLGIL